jgi:hypothetical protein
MKTKFNQCAGGIVLALLLSTTPSEAQTSRPGGESSNNEKAALPAEIKTKGKAGELSARSACGSLIASAQKCGRIIVANVEDGKILRVIYHCDPAALVFEKEGARLIVSGGKWNNSSFTINLSNGQVEERMEGGPVVIPPEALDARDRATAISERRRAERGSLRREHGPLAATPSLQPATN